MEYLRNFLKISKIKAFQNIVAIYKINSIDFRGFFLFFCCCFFFFVRSASRICSRNLFISCAIIEFFEIWIREYNGSLRCKAMELESLRCIVSRLERVVVVRLTYVLFSLETQFPKGHLNIYKTIVHLKIQYRGMYYWK